MAIRKAPYGEDGDAGGDQGDGEHDCVRDLKGGVLTLRAPEAEPAARQGCVSAEGVLACGGDDQGSRIPSVRVGTMRESR